MTLGNFFFSSSGAAAYEIEQSLRFTGNSTYFTKTFGSSGNRRKFTLSVWVKKATTVAVSPNNTGLNFFGANSGSVGDSMNVGMSASTEAIQFYQYNSGYAGGIYSFARYRDPSAWMHMVFVWDSAQATAADRMAVYVNNRVERPTGSESANTAPSQNKDAAWNYSSYTHTIGGTYQTNDMYLAEAYHIDGQALDPTSFGEYDDNGVWRPIEYTGTYGTNGFYLKFDPSATNGIGHDHSGNGNHFTPTGFTTSGTGTDVMSDTPTTNYCTVNPLAYTYVYYGPNSPQNGNLEVVPRQTYSGNHTQGVGTFPMESGKWYFEVENDGGHSQASVGIFRVSDNTSWPWNQNSSTYHYVYSASNGNKVNTSSSAYGASWSSAGDIVGVAYDGDNGTLTFYKNGTSQGTAFTGLSGTFVARLQIEDNSGAKLICNFGQRAFAYTPPTGFNALSTSNIPAPGIANGTNYFQTVLDTGANIRSTAEAVFDDRLLIVRDRVNTANALILDTVRGGNAVVRLPNKDLETTYSAPSGNSAAWTWKLSGTNASNTVGDISSTVDALPAAGISVVSYQGTGTSGDTVGHGLGVAPEFIMFKNRSIYVDWTAYAAPLGATKYLTPNQNYASTSSSGPFNNTAPTSTLITLGTSTALNKLNDYHIAFCFASVEGYCEIGMYSGGTDRFVYCGFRPAFIWIKDTDSTYNWMVYDTKRDTYNLTQNVFHWNFTGAMSNQASAGIDILSNGFVTKGGNLSGSGHNVFFIAWAENPFGGFGVSPATAR